MISNQIILEKLINLKELIIESKKEKAGNYRKPLNIEQSFDIEMAKLIEEAEEILAKNQT